MTRLPISVCLIAGNEAHRIRRTLESVAGWTTEIIVVLNHDVNDGTDQIAETFGARVYREPWKGFHTQKNSALQKATGEWILGLDADEAVSPELRAEIQQLFAGPADSRTAAAYSFPRCSFYCGRWIRHGDWYPDRQTRLWRRGAAEWGGIDPHDKLIVRGTVGRLHQDLAHYSMDDINHQLRKMSGYSDIFARANAGRKISAVDICFRPWWRFMRGYFFKRGFLDGWQGYAIARLSAHVTFLRYVKIREAQMTPAKNQAAG